MLLPLVRLPELFFFDPQLQEVIFAVVSESGMINISIYDEQLCPAHQSILATEHRTTCDA